MPETSTGPMCLFVFSLLLDSLTATTTTVFAWIFTPWALLAVTPVYVYMVRGLENAGFVKAEMEEVARLRAALPGSSVATSTVEAVEEGADKKL